MKKCAQCHELKDETEFYPNYRFRSLAARCKLCVRARAVNRQEDRLAAERRHRMTIREIDDLQVQMLLRALERWPTRQARVLAVYEARLRRIA